MSVKGSTGADDDGVRSSESDRLEKEISAGYSKISLTQTSWKILAVLPADPGQCGKAECTPPTTSHPRTPILMSFIDVQEDTVGHCISMGGP